MASPGERFTEVWDAVDPFDQAYPHLWIKVEHLGRYLFATRYLASEQANSVADIGCGTGYGASELATVAGHVVAVDGDPTQLRVAAQRYPNPKVQYLKYVAGHDALDQRIPVRSLDAAVCFETLEHLTDPAAMLHELAKLIHPGGTLIVSVPNSVSERVNDVGLPSNRLHRRLYSVTSICDLMEDTGFRIDEVLGQPLVGEINRNETRLIRRKQVEGRIGDNPALHVPETVRRLAMSIGYPEARDVERSYSITVVARRSEELNRGF